MNIMLGMGCDRGTSLQTLENAIHQALNENNLSFENIAGIATIDKKNDEIALLELAKKNNWPMIFYSAEQLKEVQVPNPSAVVMKHMGTPAVSEAAAILAANSTMKNLIVEKYKYLGDDKKNATVSIVKIN